MNAKYHSSEKGQAIVYITIGLVVFLGFVALAIDGGMALADRRHSQNAADSASLAGGGKAALALENAQFYSDNWNCDDNRVKNAEAIAVQKAKDRALANGFNIGTIISTHNYVKTECGPNASDSNQFIDVTVAISSTTQSNFLQLIFPQALHNEVEAVTRINPRRPLAFGDAIVALNPNLCQGQQDGALFYGNGGSDIYGGGVFTNGCLSGKGGPTVEVFGGYGFNYAGEKVITGGNVLLIPDPPSQPTDDLIKADDYNISFSSSNCTGHWVPDDVDIDRNGGNNPAGLYCFKGDFSTQSNDVIIAKNVTFYVEGDITFNGNSNDILEATPSYEKSINGSFPSVLFLVPKRTGHTCPDQVVKMNGTSGMVFTGIIFAPCADVTMNGDTGIVTWFNQIIGWNVHIGGNAKTIINYDKGQMMILPTNIELYR